MTAVSKRVQQWLDALPEMQDIILKHADDIDKAMSQPKGIGRLMALPDELFDVAQRMDDEDEKGGRSA